jgi:hypothetical protein
LVSAYAGFPEAIVFTIKPRFDAIYVYIKARLGCEEIVLGGTHIMVPLTTALLDNRKEH